MGVVSGEGVGVYLLGNLVRQGQLYLRRREKILDQTHNHYTSDSLLAKRLKIPPTQNHAAHCNSLTQNVHKMSTENHVKIP
jgi:hypothetical protein